MADKSNINKKLFQLGLDQNEAELYKALLLEGSKTILNLSREVDIPRTTVYRTCEELVDRNFLEWIVGSRGKKIKAVKPKDLKSVIERKEKELKRTRKAVDYLKNVSDNFPTNQPKTEVRYYYGKSGMKQMIWNTLKSKGDMFGYSMWNRTDIVNYKFEKKYTAERKRRKICDKVIIGKKGVNLLKKETKHKKVGEYQIIKVIEDLNIEGDTYCYNNVYALNTWNEGDIFGVEIENEDVVRVQKSIFKKLWKVATPIEKYVKLN